MVYITLEEKKEQKKKQIIFLNNVFEDLRSNKPESEKKYLQKILKIKEKSMCDNNYSEHGNNFFTHYHSSNNVYISGLQNSNYVGNNTPNMF